MSDDMSGAGETGHVDADDLLDLAPLVALDALSESERASVEKRVQRADAMTRRAFDVEVAAVRDTLADIGELTEQAPRAGLRDELLAAAERDRLADRRRASRIRWGAAAAAVAAVIAVGGGVVGYTMSGRDEPTQTTAERVFEATDVRTVSGELAKGRASVTFSPSAGAGVLVMNDVTPPDAGKVYQLWLVGPDGTRLGGVMAPDDVAPSTTVVLDDLGDATAMAFTVGDMATPELRIGPTVSEMSLG
ncbi:anti-sigma factor [Gordonia liuliyuniae]|uniref:Regulator of SigK n=1 Tax=Gordonia liuliyuniae TaxID=2911517 RepID=A0ABS9IW32_9ACTN|nr:anti-sigma factor [Gordonia liuliyuniae]MCF8589771.1 anti-sigma factor [Gordonia liuliyuniae]